MSKNLLKTLPNTLMESNISEYLSSKDESSLSVSSRVLETKNICRRNKYYNLNDGCSDDEIVKVTNPASGDRPRSKKCCKYQYLTHKRPDNTFYETSNFKNTTDYLNFTVLFKFAENMMKDQTSIYNVYLNINKPYLPKKYYLNPDSYATLSDLYEKFYINEQDYYQDLQTDDKYLIKQEYLINDEITLDFKICDVVKLYLKLSKNHEIWFKLIAPLFNIHIPSLTDYKKDHPSQSMDFEEASSDDLIITTCKFWPAELWCLYLTILLYNTDDTYQHLIDYPTDNFKLLYKHLFHNVHDISRLACYIRSPWEDFIFEKIPDKYKINLGNISKGDLAGNIVKLSNEYQISRFVSPDQEEGEGEDPDVIELREKRQRERDQIERDLQLQQLEEEEDEEELREITAENYDSLSFYDRRYEDY